jgi:UPF0271 protein
MSKIDINCDLGEGVGNEAQLMPYISSCNIACGAHAGSIKIIDKAIRLAHDHKVKIGAHPSYPDRENFGRKAMDMPLEELEQNLIQQINFVEHRSLALTGHSLNHVKAHGALYNGSAVYKDVAQVIINAVLKTVPDAKLYLPYRSVIEEMALKQNLNVCYEVFADRNYTDALTLVSRSEQNAVITNKEEVVFHVLRMVENKKVKTVSGKELPIKSQTCCVHGDNEKAVEIVNYLHDQLTEKGVLIA